MPVQALKLGNPLALGYRGPNLRRPIASNEVMSLARLLVRASDAANAALRLDQPATEAEQHSNDTLQVHALHLRRIVSLTLKACHVHQPQARVLLTDMVPLTCLADGQEILFLSGCASCTVHVTRYEGREFTLFSLPSTGHAPGC